MQRYVCPHQIYKYIPLSGLVSTLEHRTFKLSRPSDFNDPIDMYLQSTIGQNLEDFLEEFKSKFHDYLLNGIKNGPSNDPHGKAMLLSMHHAIINANDEDRERIKKEFLNTPIEEMYDLDRLRKTNEEVASFINTALSYDGVFCSTTDKNNLLMWAHYADHHRGAVIEYTPNIEKDSVFLASKPVLYSKERPVPYKDASAMVAGLEKASEDVIKDIVNRLVFTKSQDWAYEQEYRLLIPFMIRPEQKFTTLKFYAEELTGIYFGCRVHENEMLDIQKIAMKINPNVRLYRSIIAPKEFGMMYEAYK